MRFQQPFPTPSVPSAVFGMPRLLALLAISLALILDAGAGDRFERDDGDLGLEWLVVEGDWSINEGQAVNGASSEGPFPPGIAVWAKSMDSSAPYTVSLEIQLHSDAETAFSGIAFQLQENGDGYAMRISPAGYAQIVRLTGGEAFQVARQELHSIPQANSRYRLKLTVSDEGTFSGSVTDVVSGALIGEFTDVKDAKSFYQSGGSGLYARKGRKTFDDFSYEEQ